MNQDQTYDDEDISSTPDTEVGQKAESTWVKKILILLISVIGGIVLWSTIWTIAVSGYSMPKWLSIVITTATYFLISYLIYKGINYIKSEMSVNYPSEVLIVICALCIMFQLVNNYLREDNFTPAGQPRVFIDTTTNEKWYGEHPGTNPRTGVKLVLATPEMLDRASGKSPAISTITTSPISGRTFKVTVMAGESPYKIDKVVAGQTIHYLSADGEFSSRVNKGDNRACWGKKAPNTSYTADWNGALEAITENKTPVTFTVNII